ncbi:MAG: sulfatase-like hydrolase/transferase [Planctomycetaceae bacterium]|nr:sulfatase-like hydrolase/transferase [Planctomycetaceae bacterium]
MSCRIRTAIALFVACMSGTADSAPKPNLVLIISDDQCYTDFGFMDNPHVQTPHLDRLASRSARYVNGYVPSSVCSPSLATLLTGLYPHQHGIHYNHPPPGNAAFNRMTSVAEYVAARSRSFSRIRSLATLPRLLSEAGYRTLQTGKFWEGHYRNAGFTDGMTLFEPVPGQSFGGNRTLANGELAAHGNGDWGLKIGRETMQPISDFLDDVGKQPFFVWYAPYLPHQPHDSPQRYYDLVDVEHVPKHQVPYYASIAQFDETVGQLLNEIEQRGLSENTLVAFVVDNGWEAGTTRARGRPEEFDHTKRSKRAPFDFGLRTPILLRWPGVTKPATHSELVNSIDLMPTLLTAAGIEVSHLNLPGTDLWPSATGKESLDADRAVFGEIYPGDATSLGHPERDIAYRWVRQGSLKLIVPHSHGQLTPWGNFLTSPALFDLANDSEEKRNLISSSRFHEDQIRLRRLLDEWWNPDDNTGDGHNMGN